jgi:anti-anti-sigma factor
MTVVIDGDGALLTPEGELDRATAASFDAQLVEVIATGRSPLTIDLSGVAFADLAGYRAIDRFSQRCVENGVTHIWLDPSGPVRLLWRLLGPPVGGSLDRSRRSHAAPTDGHRDGDAPRDSVSFNPS